MSAALSDGDRTLVRLFTAGVVGRGDVLRALRLAMEPGASAEIRRAWREALLQVHVFAGFPRLVEAYGAIDAAGGLGGASADELEADAEDDLVRARGRALFERIYADDAELVRAMLARHHPDFARWIEEHAYGRVLARPGLDAERRELLAVAGLAALGQERQLASHARGALRCGSTRVRVDAVLDAIADLVPAERIERARQVVARFARDA